jgi:DNA-binding Xre family transcriptional regulator
MPTLERIDKPSNTGGVSIPFADPAPPFLSEPRIMVDRAKLGYAMERRGLNNKTLADLLGKHANSISRLKREQSCTLNDLARLCQVLNVHPLDLLSFEGFPN